ncbi:MAG: lipoxygenase family protein [Pseudomonadota bacterium]
MHDRIGHLPLRLLGLRNIPAVPFQLDGIADTLMKLEQRSEEIMPAVSGLTNTYTIGGVTAPALAFLFGDAPLAERAEALAELRTALEGSGGSGLEILEDKPLLAAIALSSRKPTKALADLRGIGDFQDGSETPDPSSLTGLSLEHPDQWSISWTNFQDVYEKALPFLPEWALSLSDADEASKQFWPTIARYGFAYNLLLPRKILETRELKRGFAAVWEHAWDDMAAAGTLYAIDLSIFGGLRPVTVDGFTRFTPSTVTLLHQDPTTKALTPIAVRVAGFRNRDAHLFTRANATDSAWIYALQAAKASVTVYGIWIGHVYHWHIVAASMQMTMFNNLPKDHPLYLMLAPQSDYLIAFDNVLLLLWGSIAPPTSVDTAFSFLRLMNRFARGRTYFDDDPRTALAQLGIEEADFSSEEPWDQYPIVADLLTIWDTVETYVTKVIDASYADDAAVAADQALQHWMADAGDPREGNVRGLPEVTSREALIHVVTSLLYRVVVHGSSRLNRAANPGLTFVANYPACLQNAAIPSPDTHIDLQELLAYLPKTGTIGGLVSFYFTFVFSGPYVPLVPTGGVETDLFYPGGVEDPRNRALIELRRAMIAFMEGYQPEAPQLHQWPQNVET